MAFFNQYGGSSNGKVTQTAGTLINSVIQPLARAISRVGKFVYTCGSTAHTITALRCIGRTTCTAVGAAGQAVINIAADPGITTGLYSRTGVAIVGTNAIAANDILIIRETDGIARQYKVSSVATLAITLTANLAVGVAIGSSVWDFGIISDTDPRTGTAHVTFLMTVSIDNTISDDVGGVPGTLGADEPIILQSDNATVAGTMQYATFAYTPN